MRHKGYYSVIQYMPDRGRMEAVNLGVVIWWPGAGECEVKAQMNMLRVRRFFPKADWTHVRMAADSAIYRLREDSKDWQSLDDFEHFVAMRANDIQMTKPRFAALDNEQDDLVRLFTELVSEPE